MANQEDLLNLQGKMDKTDATAWQNVLYCVAELIFSHGSALENCKM